MIYVCGFLFDLDVDFVALIRKNRGPREMAGKLNGIGGKVEPGESIHDAMAREFEEETGLWVPPAEWMNYHTERYNVDTNNTVHFFAAASPFCPRVRTTTDETVGVYAAHSRQHPHFAFGGNQPMYNLEYLIPMARVWLLNPKDRFVEGPNQ